MHSPEERRDEARGAVRDAAPARTLFLGSGAFAVPIVGVLAGNDAVELIGVVSAPDRPAGRDHRSRATPVAALARTRGWRLLQPERLREPRSQATILALQPDLLVLADYGQIVPPALLEASPRGALNVHPSLLPRHRGASPIPAAILAGDHETGVTIIRMDAAIDTGPVVAQRALPVAGDEAAPGLEARLAALGASLLEDVLGAWLAGALTAVPQPAEGATVTHPLRREDGRLNWTRSATELERQVRAYQPWPGSYANSPHGTLVVWRAAVGAGGLGSAFSGARPREPGTVVAADDGIAVGCGEDLLELLEVQLAGRRRMSGAALRNGYPRLIGARLGSP